MNDFLAKIEAVLFLMNKPVNIKKIAKILDIKEFDVEEGIEKLSEIRNIAKSGIHIVIADRQVSLGTNPDFSSMMSKIVKDDMESELTRPQLETLTIIAYRSPITKAEIEHIRGVNCSIILRNLLVRGLIIEKEDTSKIISVFILSSEMLKLLGVHNVAELPDYSGFHKNAKIDQMLETLTQNIE